MRKRLVFVGVCILTFPFWFSASPDNKLTNSAPFGAIAYAGHTLTGEWCPDGAAGCISDPNGNSVHRLPDEKKTPRHQIAPDSAGPGFDLGAGALMLALALFVWTRLRA